MDRPHTRSHACFLPFPIMCQRSIPRPLPTARALTLTAEPGRQTYHIRVICVNIRCTQTTRFFWLCLPCHRVPQHQLLSLLRGAAARLNLPLQRRRVNTTRRRKQRISDRLSLPANRPRQRARTANQRARTANQHRQRTRNSALAASLPSPMAELLTSVTELLSSSAPRAPLLSR